MSRSSCVVLRFPAAPSLPTSCRRSRDSRFPSRAEAAGRRRAPAPARARWCPRRAPSRPPRPAVVVAEPCSPCLPPPYIRAALRTRGVPPRPLRDSTRQCGRRLDYGFSPCARRDQNLAIRLQGHTGNNQGVQNGNPIGAKGRIHLARAGIAAMKPPQSPQCCHWVARPWHWLLPPQN